MPVNQHGRVQSLYSFGDQVLHGLEQGEAPVEHIVHDHSNAIRQIHVFMFRLLCQLGIWMQQRQVIGVAMDGEVQTFYPALRQLQLQARKQHVGQRRTTAFDAYQRNALLIMQPGD
jgi:hypothetical protein